MLSANLISSFSELPSPLLTTYLNTQPLQPSSHTPGTGPLQWLANEAKQLAENIPPAEQVLFRQQVARIEEFLRARTSVERALAILAGPATWELVPFHLLIENELHWGRPAQ